MDSEQSRSSQEERKERTSSAHGYALYLALIVLGMFVSFVLMPWTNGSASDEKSADSIGVSLLLLLYPAHLAARFLSDRRWRKKDDYVREVSWSVVDVIAMALVYLVVAAMYGTFAGDTGRSPKGAEQISITEIGVSTAGYCLMLAFAVSVLRQRGARFRRSMGLTMRPRGRLIIVGVVAFLAFQPFRIMYSTLVLWLFNWLGLPQEQHPIVDQLTKPLENWLAAALVLSVVVSAPFFEELFFRGFFFQALRKYLRPWPATALAGGLFALVHGSAFQVTLIFPLGLLLAYLMEKTGSLIPCITVHFLVNASSLILLFLAGG